MEIMKAIKFLGFYGMQITVVALVGVTLLAGLYQLVRDKVHQHRSATTTAAPEVIKRS